MDERAGSSSILIRWLLYAVCSLFFSNILLSSALSIPELVCHGCMSRIVDRTSWSLLMAQEVQLHHADPMGRKNTAEISGRRGV